MCHRSNLRTCRIVLQAVGAIWIVAASALFAADPAPPKSEKQLRVEGIVAQARQWIEKADWDAAIKDCNNAIEVDAESGLAHLVRGIARNGKGEFESAIQDFDKVTSKPASSPVDREWRAEAYSHRSFSLSQRGQFLTAIDSAYFALLEKSNHPEAYNNRALAYIGRAQLDKAVWNADAAIRSKPDFGEAYSTRGLAYAAKGNFDQAIKDQTKALELRPQFVIALQRRSAAHAEKGDFAKSLQDLDQAITAKPNFVDAMCDRAYLYGVKRDMQKAMAELDAVVKMNPTFPRGHFQRGMGFMGLKNFDEAVLCLNEAIKLKNDYAAAYSLRGYAYHSRKEYELALDDFTKAISLDPKLVSAYSGRSQVYQKLRKPREAKIDQEKVAELKPPMPSPVKPAAVKKPAEEPLQRFVVTPKLVAPAKRAEAIQSAKQVDRLVQANYEKHKVTPLPNATDEQFLRRVHLDVTGTIPTYLQMRKFQMNTSPTKRADLIDELLNSSGYASHFFNYWADVLRYTDNLNESVRGEPYRQWIKQSLAENKPWDKLVHEMLTATGLIWENPATGYLQRDPNMQLDSMNNTVRVFLGTRIGCAQCHNHPFDRWTQKEFYQMAAFTFGTVHGTYGGDQRYWSKNPHDRLQGEYAEIEQEEEDRRNNYYAFERLVGINMRILNDQVDRKIQLPKDYAYDDAKPSDIVAPKSLFGAPVNLQPGEAPRQGFSRWLTSKDNPRFALVISNRLWKQVFGVGQIEPVDDLMDETVAENPELMLYLEAEMKRLNFDMKEYLRVLLNTETYQRQACVEDTPLGSPYHFPGPMLRRMTAEQVWDSFLTLAVVDPDEYRELPANVRTEYVGVDLNTVSAKKMLEAITKAAEIDYALTARRQQKYTYKGVLLARASELPSPVPANHFLRMFGQSDREQISASSTTGSVPQVLFMFNGPITHMLLEKNSTIYNNVMKRKATSDAVQVIFETVLTRTPDAEELELAKDEVKRNGPAGFGNVIWSLVNTREFLFIQ